MMLYALSDVHLPEQDALDTYFPVSSHIDKYNPSGDAASSDATGGLGPNNILMSSSDRVEFTTMSLDISDDSVSAVSSQDELNSLKKSQLDWEHPSNQLGLDNGWSDTFERAILRF
jgi:hypothetical protein